MTSDKVNVGMLYGRWTLDCVIEAAAAISTDYVKRYRQYRDVPEATAAVLADIRSRTGADPKWPSVAQRLEINASLIGPSDAKPSTERTPFRQCATTLRAAAVAYSERVYDTGEPMLRQAFVDAARQLRAYLRTLNGSVVARAQNDTEPMFERAVSVLSDSGVAMAFGLPPAPKSSWPLPTDLGRDSAYLDGDGAFLIEEVTRTLQPASGTKDQHQFLALQRAAAAGGRSIQLVLDERYLDKEADVRELIGDVYTWSTALRDVTSGRPA